MTDTAVQAADISRSSTAPTLGPMFAERVALYFGAVFLVYGIHLTYFPVWLSWRGLTHEQIGLVTALPIVLRAVLTPFIGAYADRTGAHRAIIVGLSLASASLALAAFFAPDTTWLIAAAVPFAILMVSVLPLIDTVAVAGVRAGGHDYGRMRLWGSLTFLVATIAAGVLLDAFGAGAIMWALIAATLATAVAALTLPKRVDGPVDGRALNTAIPPAAFEPSPAPIVEPHTTSAVRSGGLVSDLLRTPVFVVFILAVGTIQASHAAFYTFGALHLQGQGVSGSAFSTLWVIAILAETALFAWSARFVRRIGAVPLLILGGAAAVVRWVFMSIDPPYAAVFALQALHALTYAATHLGAMHFIAQAVPDRGSGTAQALYSAIGNGLITAAAVYIAGQTYPALGGATYLVMGTLALFGTAAAIYVHKAWDRQPLLANV